MKFQLGWGKPELEKAALSHRPRHLVSHVMTCLVEDGDLLGFLLEVKETGQRESISTRSLRRTQASNTPSVSFYFGSAFLVVGYPKVELALSALVVDS